MRTEKEIFVGTSVGEQWKLKDGDPKLYSSDKSVGSDENLGPPIFFENPDGPDSERNLGFAQAVKDNSYYYSVF